MSAPGVAVAVGCVDLAEYGEIVVSGADLAHEIAAAYPRTAHCMALDADTWRVCDAER